MAITEATKYHTKPFLIQALRWDGAFTTIAAVNALIGPWPMEGDVFQIKTAGRLMLGEVGDWMVKELRTGNVYPVKDFVFQATYELACADEASKDKV